MALPSDSSQNPSRSSGKKVDLNFHPLSDGLGFHPFSNGLPYAPIAKTPGSANIQKSMGSGAVSAGAPGFFPPSASTRIQAPRMPAGAPSGPSTMPSNSAHSAPLPAPQPFTHPQVYKQPLKTTALAKPTETLAGALTPDLLQPTFGFGYLFKRLFAYLVDSLFNLALCAGALSLALWKQDLSPELLLTPGIVLVAALFLGFFNWAITTAQEVAFGTSIGKRLFGLAIQGGASAIFLRAFFFIPGLCFGGIGLIWALFDRRRRCWHDLVVDLQPIEIARL